MKRFNPRAHEGRDEEGRVSGLGGVEFQSTRPRRARRSGNCRSHRPGRGFNPRAHEGRDDEKLTMPNLALMFQSTRPRRARRIIRDEFCRVSEVSIHAPTKGATNTVVRGYPHLPEFQSTRPRRARHTLIEYCGLVDIVSIHAPTKGATQQGSPRMMSACCFNPRAHEGRDTVGLYFGLEKVKVSIHAPTKGATSPPPAPTVTKRFQSTRPRRARLSIFFKDAARQPFQSTRPRRARLANNKERSV